MAKTSWSESGAQAAAATLPDPTLHRSHVQPFEKSLTSVAPKHVSVSNLGFPNSKDRRWGGSEDASRIGTPAGKNNTTPTPSVNNLASLKYKSEAVLWICF